MGLTASSRAATTAVQRSKQSRTAAKAKPIITTDHPIDLTRWQVVNCYNGRAGLINSGGASSGESDLAEAVHTAVINKRAGGTGLISGRKAFQRPMDEGIALLNAIVLGGIGGKGGVSVEALARTASEPVIAQAFRFVFLAGMLVLCFALAFLIAMEEKPLRGPAAKEPPPPDAPSTPVQEPGEK